MGIPSADIEAAVAAAHAAARTATGGANASYIPFLAKVPADLLAVCAVTPDGRVFSAGDADFAFAVESVSKVFTCALAMEQRGPDAVRDKIGTRPTGMPFNSVVALEMHGDRPMSPLVNAGAIATASFVEASSPKERFDLIRGNMSAFAGRELAVSEEIYSSESATNLRNRAIAYLLASAGTCYSEPMEALDVYTRACSVLITCTDLATMAATLANGGTNPATGKRCVGRDVVPPVLAEMVMEGMYDSSGDWAFRVGLPGKSGVGGGVMAVAPGKLGIAAFSPPLDEVGNSVRAQVAVAEVAKRLGLNLFAVPEESAPAGEQPAVTLQPDS